MYNDEKRVRQYISIVVNGKGGVDEDKLIADIKLLTGLTEKQVLAAAIHNVVALYNENVELKVKLEKQAMQVSKLTVEARFLEKNGTYKEIKGPTAIQKVKMGEKTARKDYATVEIIKNMQNRGFTWQQIADKLCISKATIWRRLKEEEEFKNKYGV